MQNWINHPEGPQATAVTSELNRILPKAIDLLSKFPKPIGGVEPCNSKKRRRSNGGPTSNKAIANRGLLNNIFKTAFSLLTCVINTADKVKDELIRGTTDVAGISKILQDDLKPMINMLNGIDPLEHPESPDPTSDRQSTKSSSSCIPETVSNCKIECTAVTTTTLGGINKRTDKDSCKTSCGAPITSCGATGVTSRSTVASTTTTYQACAASCVDCNFNALDTRDTVPGLDAFSKASKDVFFIPVPTMSTSMDHSPAARARQPMPKETSLSERRLANRGFTNYRERKYGGTSSHYEHYPNACNKSSKKRVINFLKSLLNLTDFALPLSR